jgi:hypothetical protein
LDWVGWAEVTETLLLISDKDFTVGTANFAKTASSSFSQDTIESTAKTNKKE